MDTDDFSARTTTIIVQATRVSDTLKAELGALNSQYSHEDGWLHLQVEKRATFKTLDTFLRALAGMLRPYEPVFRWPANHRYARTADYVAEDGIRNLL